MAIEPVNEIRTNSPAASPDVAYNGERNVNLHLSFAYSIRQMLFINSINVFIIAYRRWVNNFKEKCMCVNRINISCTYISLSSTAHTYSPFSNSNSCG